MGSACGSPAGGCFLGNKPGSGGTVWKQVFQLCGSPVIGVCPVSSPHFCLAVGPIFGKL